MHRGNLPDGPLRQIIRMEGDSFTLTRLTKTTNEIGEVEENESKNEVDIHVFEPSRSPVQLPHGESFDESLAGLTVPTADVRDGDVLTYNGTDFEITVTPIPDETDTDYLSLDLARADTV